MNRVAVQQPALPGYDFAPQSMFNNRLANAQAAGDLRFNQKPLDRAGLSRGGAQAYQAGITGSRALADGIADAYQQQAEGAVARASGGLEAERRQEEYSQALGALQQQNAYANAMAAIQRVNALRGLIG